MKDMTNEEICQKVDHLLAERQGSVDQVWDLIERFVLPFRGAFYTTLDEEQNVDWHRRDIYDSTAVFACQSLAAALQGNLTSSSQQWFGLRFRDDELNDEDTAKEWLEEVASRCYESLSESNFDVEITEGYLDLCGYGTAVITEEIIGTDEGGDGKLTFAAVPLKEVAFEEDHNKQVHRVYRMLKWTPVQLISKFGEENVPSRVREMAAKPDSSTTRLDVVFAIYPRDVPRDIDTGKPIAPKSRPYGYRYVLKDTKENLGEEGGYYEMPAFVTRWRKTAGSRWGYSPATVELGNILTLNQVVEATLEASGKAIDPPLAANESAVINDLDLDRGALNIMTDINGIKTLESTTRFDIANMDIQMLRESIRKAFYQDDLQLKESPAMTATEVNVRYELMQRLLGPTLGRIKTDLLDRVIQRTFNILYREGRLPEIPEGYDIGEMDIEYTGPLPRSQQSDTAAAIEQWLSGIAQLAEVYPELRDLPDLDAAGRELAALRGVPAKVVKASEEVEQGREQRAQQEQMANMAAMAQQGGDAMKALGEGAQALQGGGNGKAPVQ